MRGGRIGKDGANIADELELILEENRKYSTGGKFGSLRGMA
jgi:hypothetical protein